MASRDITPIDQNPRTTPSLFAGVGPYWDLEQRIYDMVDDVRRRFADLEKMTTDLSIGARTEVSEKDGRITVRAELPGFDEDDIDVTVAQGLLTIRAERLSGTEAKKGKRSEQRHAIFQHSLLLPNGIDTDRVEAALNNGVLTVTIPLRSELAPDVKRITVQRAEGKQALSERYSADLSKFRKKLRELREEAAQLGGDVAEGLKRRIENLEGLGDRFAERLAELEEVGEGAVAGMRKRLESSWHDMSQGLSRLSERIRRKKKSS